MGLCAIYISASIQTLVPLYSLSSRTRYRRRRLVQVPLRHTTAEAVGYGTLLVCVHSPCQHADELPSFRTSVLLSAQRPPSPSSSPSSWTRYSRVFVCVPSPFLNMF